MTCVFSVNVCGFNRPANPRTQKAPPVPAASAPRTPPQPPWRTPPPPTTNVPKMPPPGPPPLHLLQDYNHTNASDVKRLHKAWATNVVQLYLLQYVVVSNFVSHATRLCAMVPRSMASLGELTRGLTGAGTIVGIAVGELQTRTTEIATLHRARRRAVGPSKQIPLFSP